MTRSTAPAICAHQWIDPEDPPIARAPFSSIIGPGRRQLKRGHRYECSTCGAVLLVPLEDRLFGRAQDERRIVEILLVDAGGELPPIE